MDNKSYKQRAIDVLKSDLETYTDHLTFCENMYEENYEDIIRCILNKMDKREYKQKSILKVKNTIKELESQLIDCENMTEEQHEYEYLKNELRNIRGKNEDELLRIKIINQRIDEILCK